MVAVEMANLIKKIYNDVTITEAETSTRPKAKSRARK